MDIISIVNTMQPNTIARLAKKTEDFHGEASIPFMGCFVQLFPGAKLPAEDAVNTYQTTYDATLAKQKADTAAKAALPDLATQVAQLTAAVAGNGIALPEAVIEAANTKLIAIGQTPIELGVISVQSIKAG